LLINKQKQAKANFSIQDAYKLIYQGTFGVAHILENPGYALWYLKTEINSINKSDSEPLMEDISLTNDLVRINLRVFKKCRSSADVLFEVMKRSAEKTNGDSQNFLYQWEKFKQAVSRGQIKFDLQQLERFDLKMKAENYPAVHHSLGYREANKPAYRVVRKDIFRKYFPNLK